MTFDVRFTSLMGAFLAIGSVGISEINAGCPCQKGGGGSAYDASYSSLPMNSMPVNSMPFSIPQQGLIPQPDNNFSSLAGVPTGTDIPATGVPGVGPGYSGATATTWQPPPGTLGRTYQMKSRPVPVTMHPRAAIVDVRIKGAKEVRVHDTNVYRTEDYLKGFKDHTNSDMWHFTAETLIPGIPHIYRIEARFDGPNGERMEERYVRLIMGRVIEVEI